MTNHISRAIAKFLFITTLFLIPFIYRCCTPSVAQPASDTSYTDDSYLLRAAGNRLIVTASDGVTTEILNIDPRTLPPHDQSALANGIYVENTAALEEILQDFS